MKRNRKQIADCVDLMLTEGHIENYYGIPCEEFGMGVNVSDFRAHNYKGLSDELNLLMVGCTSVYHGTDRILKSLDSYYKDGNQVRTVKLHLVGDILQKDLKFIHESVIEDKVICYGKRYGKELEDIYDKCNIALGPLSQHRMNKRDTGLKTKEYFAKGIPYLYSGEETALPNDYPYIMEVPNDESLINIEEVWKFYEQNCRNGHVVDDMRNTAKTVFSWNGIFSRAFSRLSEVSNSIRK